MLVPVLVLTSGVAYAAAKPCPSGWVKTGYSYGCSPSPSTPPPSTPPPSTPPPSTPPPSTRPPSSPPHRPSTTPPLPVTGADAGSTALLGGGLVAVGALFAIWTTMFLRRDRFQA
jgi:hypothetical protein